jgi:hypothetical protein
MNTTVLQPYSMAGRIHGKTKNRTSYQYRENIRIDILA